MQLGAKFTLVRDGGLMQQIAQRAKQARPVLGQWGAYLKAGAKKAFKEKAPPLAAATLKHRAASGTGSVTAQAKVRASYAANLDRALKRKGNEDARSSLRELLAGNLQATTKNRTVDRLRRRLQAAQGGLAIGAKVAIGKRQIEKKGGLERGGKMAGAFKATVKGLRVVVENAARYSKVHDEGGAVGNGAVLPAWGFMDISAQARAALAEIALRWIVGGQK